MKAVLIREPGGPETLRVAESPDPRPGRGEVLVRVRAAGVNRADLLQREGRYPAPPGAPPDIPGLEVAGEVVELGPEAEGWRPGDRVMAVVGGGGYAELAAVPAGQLMAVPGGLDWHEAAAVPEVFLTAADALLARGELAPGERVLIHAAGGGVGTAALQLAREIGASLIAGTASAGKLAAIEAAGLPLDVGVDYRTASFDEAVGERTGGAGVDVILDTVGGPYWEANVASLATLGRLVVVGLLGGRRAEVDLGALMRRRATVVGTVLRARSPAEKAALTADFAGRFLPAFEPSSEGGARLRPVLDRVYPLEEAARAHLRVASNAPFGKVVLTVGASGPALAASGARPASPDPRVPS